MTYEQALVNQWSVANHRIAFAKEAQKDGKNPDCKCATCREHLAAMASGQEVRTDERN